ncbi:MAG: hypothetical protein A3D28_06095 [Omnitrophica bacterium RIFCSPHIGHO2_02_FULL_63_14]|nr:MAG: hypothetical protein A3D28_06095 [Omnitrophica bacterium RIFCSPHIGHO2_02_FULL_63_14]
MFLFFFLLGAGSAWANVKQIKAYKEAFADEKPKCAGCHVSEKPKKEAGEHEMNEYGKKVLAAKAAESPDVETYKQVGKIGE